MFRTAGAVIFLATSVVFTPAQAWAWGAISFDELTGAVKYCIGHSSASNASTCTVNDCQGSCEVISTFDRTCAAAAIDTQSGVAHVATGPDGRQTRIDAITLCGETGGVDCAIKVAICDD